MLTHRARAVRYPLTPSSPAALFLGPAWSRVGEYPDGLSFMRNPSHHPVTILSASHAARSSGSLLGSLTQLLRKSGSLQRFRAARIESWERFAPDTWAVDFSYEGVRKDGVVLPVAGTAVVSPWGPDGMIVLSLHAEFDDRDRLRWDLALACQRLAAEPRAP